LVFSESLFLAGLFTAKAHEEEMQIFFSFLRVFAPSW